MTDREPIVAISPGTFDPVTLGHVDVIRRAAEIFDRVVIGVVRDPHHKETMFTVEERVAFLEEALRGRPERRGRRLQPSSSSTSPGSTARGRW